MSKHRLPAFENGVCVEIMTDKGRISAYGEMIGNVVRVIFESWMEVVVQGAELFFKDCTHTTTNTFPWNMRSGDRLELEIALYP